MYPPWARRAALDAQLLAQLHVDPDEIFLHNRKTCALNEVFGHAGAPAQHHGVGRCPEGSGISVTLPAS